MRLFFLLVFIGFTSIAQQLYIGDSNGAKMYISDPVHQRILMFYEDYYTVVDLKTLEQRTRTLKKDPDFYFGPLASVLIDSIPYFLSRNGGLVFEMQNDSIARIDNSYEHKMQNGNVLFERDGKIFRYGGYGFWTIHNFFTYFDRGTREWEYHQHHDTKNEAPEIAWPEVIHTSDRLYLYNGIKLNPLNRVEMFKTDEVWRYTFSDGKWDYLGTCDNPVDKDNNYLFQIQQGELKYIFQDNDVTEIDILNNRKTIYRKSHKSKMGGIGILMMMDDKVVYTLGVGKDAFLRIAPKEEFFGLMISEEKFYKTSWTRFYPILGYGLLAVLLFLMVRWFYRFNKRKKRIALLSNGLQYKNKFTECDEETMKILHLLIENKRVTSSAILGIVEKPQFSPAHNERIKVQKIAELNIKLQTLLNEREDLIRSVKSKEDKRIRLYSLDKTYFL
ncbi:hypothetical protein [Namhaeicola litoreus]|uniref:WG repeat-containing protein n=1 Tax=Namhaeicola litoreus TaxID=1052145 RepID=A0ABW3Y124_9FLAO